MSEQTTSAVLEALACGRPGCSCALAIRRGHGLTHCPVHDDRTPSLNVDLKAGKLLWHCKSGCTQDAVLGELQARGLLHEVRDHTGRLLARHERKGRWLQPDGRIGLNGASSKDMLYGLERIATADRQRAVVVVEGEKAADALHRHEILAVGSTCGAASTPTADVLRHLVGRPVVLWPDADEPGRQHMNRIATELEGLDVQVRVLEWAEAPEHGDAADYVDLLTGSDEERRAGLLDFLRTAGSRVTEEAPYAPTSPPTTDRPVGGGGFIEVGGDELAASTATLATLDYLPMLGASGWIVRGWSHLIASYPRVGKTTLLFALLREWLDLGLKVLYLSEEPKSVWQLRMGGMEGDWSGLRVVFGLGVAVEVLRTRARGTEDVVVVDAVRNLLQLRDEKDNSEIARATNPWIADARLAEKTLAMLHHSRKGGGENGEGIAGGHALMAGFDIVVEILRDPNQGKNRRLLRSWARVIEGQEAVYEKDTAGHLTLLGDPRALRLESVAESLLLVLDDEWRTQKELHGALDEPRPSEEQVRKALYHLAAQNKALRDPPLSTGSQRGKTYRWSGPRVSQDPEPDLSSNGTTKRLEVRFPCPRCGSPTVPLVGRQWCTKCAQNA